jgi:hypothetical protein
MVVDKPVPDRSQNGAGLSGMYAGAWLITLLVKLKNMASRD